ncbi:hypothetical protein DL765_008964 [Monosporascus sp. GIB2]|nr:hypothetical protein DL765_008964 [Monosporascus sp. GIB2]
MDSLQPAGSAQGSALKQGTPTRPGLKRDASEGVTGTLESLSRNEGLRSTAVAVRDSKGSSLRRRHPRGLRGFARKHKSLRQGDEEV